MRSTADLPVRVELDGVLGEEVRRWVEGEAGWQVVGAGGPLAPALTLAAEPTPDSPCVVVVPGTPTGDQVRESLLAGALDVLGWPGDRHRLLALSLPSPDAAVSAGPRRLLVAGTAGGVGTSTLTLALGGLLAWSGRTAVVVGGDDLLPLCGLAPWEGPGAAELAALGPAAAREFEAVARPLPSVPGLRVLAGDGAALGPVVGWPVDVVVVDQRTASSAAAPGRLVLVARPDGSLLRAAPRAHKAAVLLMGDGPLTRGAVRGLLGREPDGWLPASARVARAGLTGRVPSSLPGRWVAGLRAALQATAS